MHDRKSVKQDKALASVLLGPTLMSVLTVGQLNTYDKGDTSPQYITWYCCVNLNNQDAPYYEVDHNWSEHNFIQNKFHFTRAA